MAIIWSCQHAHKAAFTDAHLHYSTFELLKSDSSLATNLQAKVLPHNLLAKTSD